MAKVGIRNLILDKKKFVAFKYQDASMGFVCASGQGNTKEISVRITGDKQEFYLTLNPSEAMILIDSLKNMLL